MSLSSLHLEAFMAVARAGSFSSACKQLYITQSALSQRVLNLEAELEVSLFLRESRGIRLTEVGQKLLQYGQAKNSLEDEFLSLIKSKNKNELSGVTKLAGFSTFVRSKLLPQLGPFSQKHRKVHIELMVRETHELHNLLLSGQSQFIFNTEPINQQGFENHLIDHEENGLIESSNKFTRENTYIDHDEFDSTTADFFKIQKNRPQKYKRAYFDEIYTIIDAVELGFGRAVVPLHLVKKNRKIKVLQQFKPLKVPVYFTYFEQSFYTQLQKEIINIFTKK